MIGGGSRRLVRAIEARDRARRSISNPGTTCQLGLWVLVVLISAILLPWASEIPQSLPPGLIVVLEEPMYYGYVVAFLRELQQRPGSPLRDVDVTRVRGYGSWDDACDAVWVPFAMGPAVERRLQGLTAAPGVKAVYSTAKLSGIREAFQTADAL